MTATNLINHITVALDASSSMILHNRTLPAVADNLVKHLAERSKVADQETRVSIYTFADTKVECVVWDKDVLRLPSVAQLYHPYGNTPLIAATMIALEDFTLITQKYGDHAFLLYVLTDGEENWSSYVDKRYHEAALREHLTKLPPNVTVAAFVPDQSGVFEAKRFGFPAGNISVWDTTSQRGVEAVGETMRTATDTYFAGRATGTRSYTNLFVPNTQTLTSGAVQNVLTALHPGQYRMLDVLLPNTIAPFVEAELRRPYRSGEAYYQLTKVEKVQPQKRVALLDKDTSRLYVGPEARRLLGLPDYEVKVAPAQHPKYVIFIQSTSVNRKLVPGTKLLVLS